MNYLAIDLGAGSGRAIVGTIEDGRIRLDEVHRFTNKPVQLGDTLYWNFLSLYDNVLQGIQAAVKRGYHLEGLAVDTWGVDFGLLDKQGNLIGNPVCYRDSRTDGMPKIVAEIISEEEMYSRTGIQQLAINSIYQLFSLKNRNDSALQIVDKVLFTPDLINYFLTDKLLNEYTIASTSQLLNAKTRQWDTTLFDALGLAPQWMSPIQHAGEEIGYIKKELVETGIPAIKVFAVGSHDTASAIGILPLEEDAAFLSSGTWSLLGVRRNEPVLTEEARANDFTNEGGIDNKILFMRNITGLWLLQQLIAEWEKAGDTPYDYDYLLSECLKVPEGQSLVNSDDPLFNHPTSMRAAIQQYCRANGDVVPETKGELVRCVLESLALKYRAVMEKLQTSTQSEIKKLYVVGGGSQNKVLNQLIANTLEIEVVVGITEATAIGNIIQQAIANKQIANLAEGHQIIKNSFNFEVVKPKEAVS
ncbi:MAG: L-Rhamnulokinase [Candidatus Ordinivivax streblomastigis]|uniref:L-Rhamnulokinase n=1 Tax=Candidatus Ordinivivax streblomastigis TaxID=2540710 RepID=A0A5M8P1I0_9BACT|nr:MAG: L-Rhamnulokinase [Candidatus Ordinivivax streblomastigis]